MRVKPFVLPREQNPRLRLFLDLAGISRSRSDLKQL